MRKLKRAEQPAEKTKFLGASSRHMKYKDIKRKAIALGMPFPDSVNCSIFDMLSFIDHSTNKPDKSLIDKYDEWVDKHLEEIGIQKDSQLRDYRLRLGFLGEENDEGVRKSKRVRGMKKPKEKKAPREKDALGLVKGTKKSYTFYLTSKGHDLERITRRVKEKFPEANDKSISLWYRAAKRKLKKDGV